MIPDFYKIEAKNSNINLITERIRYIINNYEACNNDMELYRKRILNEKELFYKEIDAIFIA